MELEGNGDRVVEMVWPLEKCSSVRDNELVWIGGCSSLCGLPPGGEVDVVGVMGR